MPVMRRRRRRRMLQRYMGNPYGGGDMGWLIWAGVIAVGMVYVAKSYRA